MVAYVCCLLYIWSADIFLSLNLTPGNWRSMQCTQQVSDKLCGSGAVVLQSPTRSHKVLQGPTMPHKVPQGPTRSYKVPQGPTRSHNPGYPNIKYQQLRMKRTHSFNNYNNKNINNKKQQQQRLSIAKNPIVELWFWANINSHTLLVGVNTPPHLSRLMLASQTKTNKQK